MQLWRVLDIPEFQMFQVSAYASVTQASECGWIWLNNGWIDCADYGRVVNMPGQVLQDFEYASRSKCQGLKYGKLVNMRGLHTVLNIPELA